MIRAAALAAVLVALGGCDAAARAETPDADIKRVEIERMSFGDGVTVIRDEKRDVTCWVFEGFKKGGISCLPDWMLKSEVPSAAPAHQPTWGDGRPCAGHKVCEGFSNRREALACAEGRLTGPACDAWTERQREDRGL